MLFNSIEFIIFFIAITTTYFLIPHRYRWMLLLASSCFFYMVFIPIYIFILFVTILIDYCAGMWIEDTRGPRRRLFLIMSIISTCSVLFIFKYFNFFATNINAFGKLIGWNYSVGAFKLILPIGLSFHTFQSLSYVIEVYRGHQKAERHFGIYSLYVMFYPQLVAGPIERPQHMLHQFYQVHHFDSSRVVSGLKQILWGLFKKIVIADRLAIYVNAVYGNAEYHNGITFLVATFFFAFQIYCDFSGYSDIAIGAARVMGFDLMTNFKRPYFARSISEFWKRWHISLSTWFRDYLYISLGGNRVTMPRWYLNLLIVFLVSGLWHGANWTYVIWGLLHGIYLIFALTRDVIFRKTIKREVSARWQRFSDAIDILCVFVLVGIAWIFFRAENLNEAFLILNKLLHPKGNLFVPNLSQMIFALFGITFLLLAEWREEYYPHRRSFFENKSPWVKYLAYSTLVVLILLIGVFDGSQFIYFQF